MAQILGTFKMGRINFNRIMFDFISNIVKLVLTLLLFCEYGHSKTKSVTSQIECFFIVLISVSIDLSSKITWQIVLELLTVL